MKQDLKSALRRQHLTVVALIFISAILIIPLVLMGFSKVVELNITPAEAADAAQIRPSNGFAYSFSKKQLVLSANTTFEVTSVGYVPALVEYKKSSLTSVIDVKLTPLPGIIGLTVNSTLDFEIDIPQINVISTRSYTEFEAPLGELEVIVKGQGLETLVETIEVRGKGERQDVIFETIQIQGSVTFNIVPKNVEVRVNGQVQEGDGGSYALTLSDGAYDLSASLSGYQPQTRVIQVDESDEQHLGLIALTPKDIKARITSSPAGASFFLNDKFRGETPLTLYLSPLSKYKIQLRKNTYSPISEQLSPTIGQDLVKNFRLQEPERIVHVKSNLAGQVLLNGVPKGQTPMSVKVTNDDVIAVNKPGYVSDSVVIRADILDQREIRIELIAESRELFVKSPAIAELEGVSFLKIEGRTLSVPSSSEYWMAGYIPNLYLSETLVTRQQYAKLSGGEVSGAKADHPQTGVSWQEAVVYCNWLSDRGSLTRFYDIRDVRGVRVIGVNTEANGFRLPTLNEWVFLITEGKPSGLAQYPWGNDFDKLPRGLGNFAGREFAATSGMFLTAHSDEFAGLSPVKSFRPSRLGFYDVVGNAKVWLHSVGKRSGEYFADLPDMRHTAVGASYLSSAATELESLNVQPYFYGEDDIGLRIVRTIK